MKLHKHLMDQQTIARSKSIVLKEAVFPCGFMSFMDALVRDNVVCETYQRTEGAIGYRWNDTRTEGGLLIETERYPIDGRAGTVVIEGVPEALELAERLIEMHGVQHTQ